MAIFSVWLVGLTYFARGLMRAGRAQRELLSRAASEASIVDTMVSRAVSKKGGTYQQGFFAWLGLLACLGATSGQGSVMEGLLGSMLFLLGYAAIGQVLGAREARQLASA